MQKWKQTTWLWPDRTIGKRESADLREEHNALVNERDRLREALEHIADTCRAELAIEPGRTDVELAKAALSSIHTKTAFALNPEAAE